MTPKYTLISTISSRNSGGRIKKAIVENSLTGQRFLIKSSTPFGHEPISEAMAYSIGTALGFQVCSYEVIPSSYFPGMVDSQGKYLSICPMLDTLTSQVVSITHIKNELNAARASIGQSTLTNQETAQLIMRKEWLDRLIFFDALIGNKDRHWRNVHLFKNADGTFSECPYIDNGDSLLATDFIPMKKFSGNKSCTLATTHDKQIETITTIDTSQLNPYHMADLAVNSILRYKRYLSKYRYNQIEKYLYARVYKYYSILAKHK